MIKNLLFDLDGTLINTSQDKFNEKYFKIICDKFNKLGYEGEKLSSILLQGLKIMIFNDGSKSNETAFWEFFENSSSIKKEELIDLFEEFYDNEYNLLNDCVKKIELTKNAINILKNKGYNLILATNPLFPRKAIVKRASWGDIDCNNFSYITSYENSCYAKPNINYYKEIIFNNNLKLEETMMFGNDLIEDLIIEKLNIPCYIITDNMINLENLQNCNIKGSYNDFMAYINKLPIIN